MARLRFPRVTGALIGLLVASTVAGAWAQTPATPREAGKEAEQPASPDPLEAEMVRARILGRLGRVEDALAAYRALLERYGDDRRLREDYAEFLVDAGLFDQAASVLDRYLADDPTSARLRRLRARVDLARGAPAEAERRLGA
ncbi:MAG TPA: tetratricopeptide repeat protein, partial [Methylomirabilota bacterium]|nr:tetratricopeptide repeat protein [Methylomirabilota bacterium]